MTRFQSLLLFIISLLPLHLSAQSEIDHWESVVLSNDDWSYLVPMANPAAEWVQPTYNDSAWSIGPGGFGYGDGDDSTIVAPTHSVYLRINFNILDSTKAIMGVLHADYDDAFVAYLNGTEIARSNIGSMGIAPNFDDLANGNHEASLYQGGVPESYPLYSNSWKSLINEGQNTLAIQVHNRTPSSSDLSSNFFLSVAIGDTSSVYRSTPEWFYEPFMSSHLPLIKISTNGQSIMDEPKIAARMEIVAGGPNDTNYISDPGNDYDGQIAIEIRGASSQSFAKKNYSFETQNPDSSNNNVSLLSLPEENDWVLHGPYTDKSLIRNVLSYRIGRSMMDYAPRTRFCELIIDNDYRGIYILTEKIKRDNNRLDIATLNADDTTGVELTGGYIFQLDRDDPSTTLDGWYSPYGSSPFYSFHYPNYRNLHPQQRTYLKSWMNGFEGAMAQSDYASTFDEYIDLPSFIDYFLINELTKHVDAFKLSFYMYKAKDDNGGKLHMGPVWDFNLGYGNFDFGCNPNPPGWIYTCTSRAFWLDRIVEIDTVQEAMYCRWSELREGQLHTDTLMNMIDDMVTELGPATDRNFERFDVLGRYVWPNYYVGDTHAEEINYLKQWLSQRLDWMDDYMFGKGSADCTPNAIEKISASADDPRFYPNPFVDQVNLSLSHHGDFYGQLYLYNLQGSLVYLLNIEGSNAIRLESLPSGCYFYELSDDQGKIFRGKLIKR